MIKKMAQKVGIFLKQNTRKGQTHLDRGWDITTGVGYFGPPTAFPTDISDRLMYSIGTQMVHPRIFAEPHSLNGAQELKNIL